MTPGKSDEEEEEDGTTPSESPRPGDRGGKGEVRSRIECLGPY